MKTDRDISGAVCVDKPAGMTSHDVVMRMRRLYGTRKVGHTGTLDPMATGALVVLIGRTAKAAEYITAQDKEYVATLQLGYCTDTGDVTGTVLERSDVIPTCEQVQAAVRCFLGETEQIPPMYSALKVNGQKLVDLARQGIEVERQARTITISALDCHPISEQDGTYELRVVCSKGTYIRTLCEDIGKTLGCFGTMASLRRVRTGSFSLSDAVTLDELEQMEQTARDACLKPTEKLFSDLAKVIYPPFFSKLARSGCEIYQKKISVSYPAGTMLALYDEQGFFGLGEAADYPDGAAIRTVKLFRIGED